jgi:hypothetical protein
MRGLVFVVLLAGCMKDTRVTESWYDPDIQSVRLDDVVAVALMPDEATRRASEDEMVAELRSRGLDATPGYELLDSNEVRDVERVREELAGRFDSVLTMRLVAQQDRVTYVPPSPSAGYGFWGWYGWAAPIAYDPGYYDVDTVVRVETNLYDLDGDKLLFTSTSETVDPDGVRDLTDDVLQAVGERLERQGVIVAP